MEWIYCNDKLPPNGVYVLIAKFDHRKNVNMFFIKISCRYNKIWIDDHNGELLDPKYGEVTHWMNLPDEPKK